MREANCSPISWKVRCISSRVHKFHSHLRSIPPLKTLPSFRGWQQLHLTPLGFERNSEKPDTLCCCFTEKIFATPQRKYLTKLPIIPTNKYSLLISTQIGVSKPILVTSRTIKPVTTEGSSLAKVCHEIAWLKPDHSSLQTPDSPLLIIYPFLHCLSHSSVFRMKSGKEAERCETPKESHLFYKPILKKLAKCSHTLFRYQNVLHLFAISKP